MPLHQNIFVASQENPVIKYSSLDWEWESWDRPEYADLRERENLDEIVAGSRTEFEAQVRLLNHVSGRWTHSGRVPRISALGRPFHPQPYRHHGFGRILPHVQHASLRHAPGVRLERAADPHHASMRSARSGTTNTASGYSSTPTASTITTTSSTPASRSECTSSTTSTSTTISRDRPIDWMNDWISWMDKRPGQGIPGGPRLADPARAAHHYSSHDYSHGFINAGFMRVVPRNNWYDKPYPKPLTHNSFTPWDGYVNWYDAQSPYQRHYSCHTDRARDLWPDLNLVHVDATSGFVERPSLPPLRDLHPELQPFRGERRRHRLEGGSATAGSGSSSPGGTPSGSAR